MNGTLCTIFKGKKVMKDFYILLSIIVFILASVSGVMGLMLEATEGCRYNTYLTKYNPPFRVGCELQKERF